MGLDSIFEEDSVDQTRAASQNHTSNAPSYWMLSDSKEMQLAEICITSIGKLLRFPSQKPVFKLLRHSHRLSPIHMHPELIFKQSFITVVWMVLKHRTAPGLGNTTCRLRDVPGYQHIENERMFRRAQHILDSFKSLAFQLPEMCHTKVICRTWTHHPLLPFIVYHRNREVQSWAIIHSDWWTIEGKGLSKHKKKKKRELMIVSAWQLESKLALNGHDLTNK